jgi:hypothetical protein
MAACLADLILRPNADRPAVQVALTLVTGVDTLTGSGEGADEPGEVDGDLAPAPLVRELAYTLGLLPRPEPTAHTESDVDVRHGAVDEGQAAGAQIDALRACELAAAEDVRASLAAADGASATRSALTRLLDARRLIGSALAERPRIAVTDQLTGALLALTDSTAIRAAATSGRGLGPPPDTDAYRPTDPLYRFVRLRDRRCRFPGCRVRARCCDLDHQVPFPHGCTAHDNLACLCEHHHRLSHQAPGWRLHRESDGAWSGRCPAAAASPPGRRRSAQMTAAPRR